MIACVIGWMQNHQYDCIGHHLALTPDSVKKGQQCWTTFLGFFKYYLDKCVIK